MQPNAVMCSHHVVYSVTADDELVIEAVPLQHYNDIDPTTAFDVSDFVDLSDPTVELGPWLPGLPLSIAQDQPLLAHMRYYAAKSGNTHWTCPLRQVSEAVGLGGGGDTLNPRCAGEPVVGAGPDVPPACAEPPSGVEALLEDHEPVCDEHERAPHDEGDPD